MVTGKTAASVDSQDFRKYAEQLTGSTDPSLAPSSPS